MSEARAARVAAAKSRLVELAAKFLERTAGEFASMRESLDRLGVDDKGEITKIRDVAHRMCGTGATLGFDALSECAGRVELLADSLAQTAVRDVASLAQLRKEVDALGAELGRLGGTASARE